MIMKKMLLVATWLLLSAVSVCAQGVVKSSGTNYGKSSSSASTQQSLTGSWIADQEFKDMFELKDSEVDMDFIMVFGSSSATLTVNVKAGDEDMTISMEISYDGTYSRSGQTVTTSIDKSNPKFKIISIESNDPETKEMLANETTRKLIYSVIEEQVKDSMKDDFEQIAQIADVFKKFEVVSISSQKLMISIEDTKFGFNRLYR